MSEMIPTIPALGILFDVKKIESGGYGIESWKIFWRAINGKHLFAKLFLYEGDLAENVNIFCIAVQAFDKDILNKIKKIIGESNEYKKVSSNPNFIEDSQIIRELLPRAGIIEPNGNFIPNGYNSNAAFKKVAVPKAKKAFMPEVQEILCSKCGSHEFDYDSDWKEYSCKKCGWIVKNANVFMPEVQEILCSKCGSHDFDYDSDWKEYSCKKCGWIVEDAQEIAALSKMLNSNLIPKRATQEESVKPLKEQQIRKEDNKDVVCPLCGGEFEDTVQEGYHLNVYECIQCGLKKLRCGNTKCDGYMEGKLIPIGYDYTCTKCGWNGVSGKKPPS